MTTKESLLTMLEARQGSFVSGEEIARTLRLSRAAVCKAVKTLRQEGYAIESATNRGYCLTSQGDLLSVPGIRKYLSRDFDVTVSRSVDSTNAVLRLLAEQGAPEGTAVIANAQTSGRGRYGRVFLSPADTGVYLSLLLRPVRDNPRQAVMLTAAAAVALCRAIELAGGGAPQIKWVNDIYLRGKKVCGILTEGAFSLETGAPEYMVVGVGINAYAPKEGFPEELSGKAGALWDRAVADGRNKLVAGFLDCFWDLYMAADPAAFLEEYRSRSIVIHRDVLVAAGDTQRKAHTLGIDEECRLLVRFDTGEEAALSYGEVRILAESAV